MRWYLRYAVGGGLPCALDLVQRVLLARAVLQTRRGKFRFIDTTERFVFAEMAFQTTSGVSGSSRMRTPMAS